MRTNPHPRVPGFWKQLLSLAFVIGLGAALGTDLGDEATNGFPKVASKDFLVGAGALGMASGAIILAVLALVAVWFDDAYQEVLDQQYGGWVKAMRPIVIIGFVSILTTIASIAALFLLQVQILWIRALSVGVTGGLLMWSLVGDLMVISLLYTHGRLRSETSLNFGTDEKRNACLSRNCLLSGSPGRRFRTARIGITPARSWGGLTANDRSRPLFPAHLSHGSRTKLSRPRSTLRIRPATPDTSRDAAGERGHEAKRRPAATLDASKLTQTKMRQAGLNGRPSCSVVPWKPL